jgi:UDP-N-acetyl-D-mannosaminuronate dehydrogenase
MPEFFVEKLEEKIGDLQGKSILVLGVSYRDKVKETAFTGAYDVRDALLARKAIPSFIDPLYSQEELAHLGFTAEFEPIAIEGIILHTDHEEFKVLDVSDYPNLKASVNGRDFA